MESIINGARIQYERSGVGTSVVMLHAGVADHRMWEPQVAVFTSCFDVITPDMRGAGGSELPPAPWSPASDLHELLEHLHVSSAHLVACSIGAAVAIDFALQHPEAVSKLVLVGPGISGGKFGQRYPELWVDFEEAMRKGDVEAANRAEMRLWLDGPGRPRGYVKKPLQDLFLAMNGPSFHLDFKSAPRDEIDPPAIERLHEVKAPMLVIIGEDDAPPIHDAVELLLEKIHNVRKIVMRDAAHLPNLEHPEEFNRLVIDFLLERAG